MKKYIGPSIKLTLVLLLMCCVLYPLNSSSGVVNTGGGRRNDFRECKVVGYERIGQKFTDDKYFWGRPSAVDYNAAGSAGSNKGPTNPDYLKQVQDRIDSFLAHNPGVKKEEIPVDLVTASGSGLDPDISPEAAYVQVKRVAKIRGLNEEAVKALVNKQIEKPVFGPADVHVLKLNIELDKLK
jgi:K+-transporting ATPase ATPase C chain